MDLGRYIHRLLKHRKDVYVKGLGVFKRMHTPSVYDENKGIYLPPMTYLEFDAKGTSGIDFVEYFQQSNDLSRSEAELEVESAVLELFEQIKNEGMARLTHVGQLVRHGTSLVFKPEDLAGFQLQPITADPLPEKKDVDIDKQASPDQRIEEESIPAFENQAKETDVLSESQNAVPSAEEEDVEVEPENNRSKWYLWVAGLAALLIAGLFYFNGDATQNTSADEGQASTDSSVQKTEALDTAAGAEDTVSSMTSMHSRDDLPLIPENHTFQIVIGTHNTLAQAFEQAESFNKAGFVAVRVIPSKLAHNKKRVIWDTYETKAEADSALRYVRRYHVSDAWHQRINP